VRKGGGILAVLGVLLAAVGVSLVWAAATMPLKIQLGFVAVAALGGGILLLFAFQRIIIDRAAGSITRDHGLLVPLHKHERSLSDFDAIVITSESDSDSGDSYPVKLRASAGWDFVLTGQSRISESRNVAEYLSRFLNLPLIDAITDHEVIVSPEEAAQTFTERLLSSAPEPEPVRPAGMRSQVRQTSQRTVIIIPGHDSPLGRIGALIPLCGTGGRDSGHASRVSG
jgi:hypothetical protein